MRLLSDEIINSLKSSNIYCIGRNYAKHAEEMGANPEDEPIVFMKPSSALISNPKEIELPDFSKNIHHEVELVFRLKKDAFQISQEDALEYIDSYAVGIDFTARDLQQKAKEGGKPWLLAKGFYNSAPISDFIPAEKFQIDVFGLKLNVNGETRQKGLTDSMIWSIPQLIEYLSHRFYLIEGDVIFTGTPEGVSQVNSDDRLEAYLNEHKLLDFMIK